MRLREVQRLYRRTLLIYVCAIVAPMLALLWLGVQSLERQRQALGALRAEKLAAEIEKRTRAAARAALQGNTQAGIARYRFVIEEGTVVRPPLHAPPPSDTPLEFLPAEKEELGDGRPVVALELYRKLLDSKPDGLALARVARCLAKLGRAEEARATWRALAAQYPDARDLAHRPYGIVAAIEAGDTAGLYDQISQGRWNLSADQAEYFLAKLDPLRSSPYLDYFSFARELNERFRHEGRLDGNELYRDSFLGHTVFYRAAAPGRIEGFEVHPDWLPKVTSQVKRELGFDSTGSGVGIYAGALALVIAILSAGVFLLLRDVSREASAIRLRSDFVSAVSHELRTPVTVIRLYAETLLRDASFDEGQRRDFYRIIMRESGRLASLIDRVLAFSRLERGSETYRLEPGDPVPVIARTLDDYREYLDQAGFHLERHLPDRTAAIAFDPTALSQALINLLENAIKYSGEGRAVKVRLATAQNDVVVEVEDYGVGIAKAEQAKVFERFYRVQNGTGKGGYGLGLYLVRRIMDAHGGRAEVESELGRGSRFRLFFPVVNA